MMVNDEWRMVMEGRPCYNFPFGKHWNLKFWKLGNIIETSLGEADGFGGSSPSRNPSLTHGAWN